MDDPRQNFIGLDMIETFMAHSHMQHGTVDCTEFLQMKHFTKITMKPQSWGWSELNTDCNHDQEKEEADSKEEC